jgi:hypothetical protein
VSVDKIMKRAYSLRFISMVDEARDYGLVVSALEDDDVPFNEWIPQAQSRAKKNRSKRIIRIVTGEFNHVYWNSLPASFWSTCIKDKWDVWAVCSPIVDYPNNGQFRNDAFDFFRNNSRPGGLVRLFQTSHRLDCHWILVGDELRLTDSYRPLTIRKRKTLVVESGKNKKKTVADFGNKTFRNTLFWIDPLHMWNPSKEDAFQNDEKFKDGKPLSDEEAEELASRLLNGKPLSDEEAEELASRLLNGDRLEDIVDICNPPCLDSSYIHKSPTREGTHMGFDLMKSKTIRKLDKELTDSRLY